MPRIARAHSADPGEAPRPLRSPYEPHAPDLILPGEDFSVRATTISKSILDEFGEKMKRGRYGNDYFVLMSHFGIGSNQGKMPSNTINLVEPCDVIDGNILSFWGENIRWIQDYRDRGSDGNAGRVFIGTSAFCQGIGSPLDPVRRAFQEVCNLVGRFAPVLTPYTSIASQALKGVVRIADKIVRNRGEVVTASLSLYPHGMGSLPAGDAVLQRGSYVFFFRETDLDHLFLTDSGEVVASRARQDTVPPYVVVNIVNGLVDAPDTAMLDKAVALDILEKYDSRFRLPRHAEETGSGAEFREGLEAMGRAYRLAAMLRRYGELKDRPNLLATERTRLEALREELGTRLPMIRI